jgi:hypothetical protein
MPHRRLAAFIIFAVFAAGGAPAWPADEPVADAVAVSGPAGAPVKLTGEDVAKLPAQHVSVSFLTEHGQHNAAFDGPLLWVVLEKTGVIDPAKRRDQVSETIVITGHDGYRATLALGEIAPDFEGKSVLLADHMDGAALGAGHLRIVVPLDKHGGRSVRDVVSIEVKAAPAAAATH